MPVMDVGDEISHENRDIRGLRRPIIEKFRDELFFAQILVKISQSSCPFQDSKHFLNSLKKKCDRVFFMILNI